VEHGVHLLKLRFGTADQSGRFGRNCGIAHSATEKVCDVYIDICRQTSLAFQGPFSTSLEIITRDAFLNDLDETSRVRILEHNLQTLAETVNIAKRFVAIGKGNTKTVHAKDQPKTSIRRV
jgi:RecA-family ATPase